MQTEPNRVPSTTHVRIAHQRSGIGDAGCSAEMMSHRYHEWLSHVFDHSVTNLEWYFDLDAPPFEADESAIAKLIDATFRHSAHDLLCFSDAQVNQGLWFLSSPAGSDYALALRSDTVPLDVRLSAISSIKILYRDCFAKRCTPTLSHLDEQPSSPLNAICYMFWDVSPIAHLEGQAEESELADACFSVLADTLAIDHIACQEAAIHGYGELHLYYPDRVEEAMNRFLKTRISDSRLRTYAENAQIGCIQ